MPVKKININSGAKRAALIAGVILSFLFAYFSAKWAFAHTVAIRAEEPEVAFLAAELAPDDPQTHYAAGILFEQTFVPDDIERSLNELEKATAASPNDYLLWLALGRARERSGDEAGAEAALRRALELAPNYSKIQWALGNALLRQGRMDEGFAEIRRAVAGDPAFTDPAASAAWQILDGDLTRVREAIGDSPQLNASLASLLASQRRFDEAFQVWTSLPNSNNSPGMGSARNVLYQRLLAAKRFRQAALVGMADADGTDNRYAIGTVTNGGFEGSIRKNNPTPFEWQIQDGAAPLIGQTDGQKHDGMFSLLISFGSGTKDFRQIAQTVAVEPGKTYELQGFYKADLKTVAAFKWVVVDASENKPLASSPLPSNNTEWTPISVRFTLPANSDGVSIQLVRENCSGTDCNTSGNLWFDDLRLFEGS